MLVLVAGWDLLLHCRYSLVVKVESDLNYVDTVVLEEKLVDWLDISVD